MNENCQKWACRMPKADLANNGPERYALVLGPLADDSDVGQLGVEEVAFLKAKAGAIIEYQGDGPWAIFYDYHSTLAEEWEMRKGDWDTCDECGKCLCICPLFGREGSPPWG